MAIFSQSQIVRAAAGLCWLGLMAMAMPQPASAGFFDRLFDSLSRAVEAPPRPPADTGFVDPFTSLANHFNNGVPRQERLRGATSFGPSKAFCVRTCDGRYFPVQAHGGMSAAESCHSFCPASETKLYAGSNIDYATGSDGSRYADMPNAFVYRKAMVAGCTCNGRNAFGLAHIDANNDPTLRPGDIVATETGFAAYVGSRNRVAEFTPVENYGRLSKAARDKLAETKVAPPAPLTQPAAGMDITSSIPPAVASARAQASR